MDDLVIVPLGIMLAVSLVPEALMMEFRVNAAKQYSEPGSKVGTAFTILIWILLAAILMWWFWPAPAE